MQIPAILYHYLQTIRRSRFRTRAALRAWQAEQVTRHLRRVVPRSAFYGRHYAGHALDDWRALPLVDKATLMAAFNAWNTVGARWDEAMAVALRAETSRDFAPTLRGVTVGLSSGTSGQRGLFLATPAERHAWAGTVLAKLLPAPLWVPQRIAFFLRANSRLYQSVASRHLRFRYFDLLDPLAAHIEQLNRFAPTILIAPPAMLRLLAQADDLDIAPRRVISVADLLDPLDEAIIAGRFGQRVHQIYQATEGLIAASCRLGTLHLAEDVMAIQADPIETDSGRFVPILTDFHRTSQPILRYRLDDVLTACATPCPCGSPFFALSHIEGRCDDLFWLPSAASGALRPVFPDTIRRTVLLAAPHVDTYRVRQRAPDQVDIALTVAEEKRTESEEASRLHFQRLWDAAGVRPPHLTFIDPVALDPMKKQRRVESWVRGP